MDPLTALLVSRGVRIALALLFLLACAALLGVIMLAGAASLATAASLALPAGCGAGPAVDVAGGAVPKLDADQTAIATTIVSVVATRGLPARAAVIALATAYQETKFVNYTTHTDSTTSLGIFAQMTIYYGYDVATDPARATGAFLDLLVQQPNWQTRPLTEVAADVQKPYEPYRGLYAQWEPMATTLTTQLWSGASTVAPACSTADSAAVSALGPDGLTFNGSPAGNTAVAFAMDQIGEPYVWGATGPSAWDCSGLTMQAWASAGVTIPRVTYTQATAGTSVSIAEVRSGDLVLIPGSDGTAANPGHVGMVAGTDSAGATWLVEAPRTGLNVRLSLLSGWTTQIVTIRRIG